MMMDLHNDIGNGMTAEELHTGLDSYENKDDYKADADDIVTAILTSPEMIQLSENSETILDYQGGNWTIEHQQMIFFRRDGSVLTRFDLKNKAGIASDVSVFRREKV